MKGQQKLDHRYLYIIFCFILTIGLVFGPTCIYAQTNKIMVLEFSYEAPMLTPYESLEGEKYIDVAIPGIPSIGDIGEPVLPIESIQVPIPYGAIFTRIEITEKHEESIYGEYCVRPGQEPLPYSSEVIPNEVKPGPIYETQDYIFKSLYSSVNVGKARGYSILSFSLHPVNYKPALRKLFYYSYIKVSIHYQIPSDTLRRRDLDNDSENRSLNQFYRGLIKDKEYISYLLANKRYGGKTNIEEVIGEALGTYPKLQKALRRSRALEGSLLTGSPCNYIIITNEELKAITSDYNLQRLAEYKDSLGLKVGIFTVESIADVYDGTRPDGEQDLQTKIRNFIIDAYNSWDIEYVLLAGDGDGYTRGDKIIPARGLYASAGHHTQDNNIASDLYYAALDGNFDFDCDGVYGEVNDGENGGEVDLYAEVFVGRAPMDNQEEMEHFVRKTIEYETNKMINPEDSYLKRALMVGEHLGFGGPATFAKNSLEEIRIGSTNYGHTTRGFPEDWDVRTLYQADQNWGAEDLIGIINGNNLDPPEYIHIINHLGHCNLNWLMMLNRDLDDVSKLTNDKYFIGYSQGCYPASFDNRKIPRGASNDQYDERDCIVEELLGSAYGCVAMIANSRYGWGEFNTTAGPSNYYHREFIDALFDEDLLLISRAFLGQIFERSRQRNAVHATNIGVMRWVYYELNLLGDPHISFHVSSRGVIALGREKFSPGQTIEVKVLDLNANQDSETQETFEILITTNGGDFEYVTLTETSENSYMFAGQINTRDTSKPTPNSNILEIVHNQQILFSYNDFDNGQGVPETIINSSDVDGVPPALDDISATDRSYWKISIKGSADEPCLWELCYGTQIQGGDIIDKISLSNHKYTDEYIFDLTLLNPETTYYYYFILKDKALNTTIANNNAQFYTFNTLKAASILLVDNDLSLNNGGKSINSVEDPFIKRKYSSLLEDLGYSYFIYEIPFNGQGPDSEILKCFETVIWVMGENNYLNSFNRANIEQYLANGGSLLLISPCPNSYYMFNSGTTYTNGDFMKKYMGIESGQFYNTPSSIVGVSNSFMDSINTLAASDWRQNDRIKNEACAIDITDQSIGLIQSEKPEHPYLAAALKSKTETGISYRSIFFGFELTFVEEYEARKDIMKRAINWLMDPGISAVSVKNNGSIPPGLPVRIKFNKPVKPEYIKKTGAVTISPGIPFSLDLNNDNTILEVKPTSGQWNNNISYTLTINNTFALDEQEYTLSAPYQLRFTSDPAQGVNVPYITVLPANEDTNIAANSQIHITFSAPVDPLSINTSTVSITQDGIPIPGNFSFQAMENLLIYHPYDIYEGGKEVLLNINGLKAENGASISNYNSRFTVKKSEILLEKFTISDSNDYLHYITETNPGMKISLRVEAKNKGPDTIDDLKVALKPITDNVYPFSGWQTVWEFRSLLRYKQVINSWNFYMVNKATPSRELAVFDIFYLAPNRIIGKKRIQFYNSGVDITPPQLAKYQNTTTPIYLNISPTKGLKEGSTVTIEVYVEEPGDLNQVVAEIVSLDGRTTRSIALNDPYGDHFFKGTWTVDFEDQFYVTIKATDKAGNTGELVEVDYLDCRGFSHASAVLFVYDSYHAIEPGWMDIIYKWEDILKNASIDSDTYIVGNRGILTTEVISGYDTIIWVVPEGYYYGAPPSIWVQTVQDMLIQHMVNGGNLLVIGDFISSLSNTVLYKDFLHATCVKNVSPKYLNPVNPFDPVSAGGKIYIQDTSSYDKASADIIKPITNNPYAQVTPLFYDDSGDAECVALRVATDNFRIVYFAFDFEDVLFDEDKTGLIQRSITWLSPPEITGIAPTEGLQNVPRNANILVYFSEGMDAQSVQETFTISPDIAGSFEWRENNRCMHYNLKSYLLSGAEYTITIGAQARDESQQEMGADYSWSFMTSAEIDTTPPSLSLQPTDGSTEVPPDTIIEISFSEPMDITSIMEEDLAVEGLASGRISGDIEYSHDSESNTWKLIFTPYKPFPGRDTITVTAGTSWRDLAGNTITDNHVSSFTIANSGLYVKNAYVSGGGNPRDNFTLGEFVVFFICDVENITGETLSDIRIRLETSSEFINQPYRPIYPNYNMENCNQNILEIKDKEIYKIGNLHFYTRSECPAGFDCMGEIFIPFVINFTDDHNRTWSDSFTFPLIPEDKTAPLISDITRDPDDNYIPVGDSLTIGCFIFEPGFVEARAILTNRKDPSDVKILTLEDPDDDRYFSVTFTPQEPKCYSVTIEAEDKAGNIDSREDVFFLSSLEKELVPEARVLVVCDYKALNTISDASLKYYTEKLDRTGYKYNLWEPDIYGRIPYYILKNHDAILWIHTPSNYASNYGLRNKEVQEDIMKYLDNGGSLLLISSIIGERIGYTVTYSDLFTKYLFVEYVYLGGLSEPVVLIGKGGDPISDGLDLHFGPKLSNFRQCFNILEPNDQYDVRVGKIYSYRYHALEQPHMINDYPDTAAVRVNTPDYRAVYFGCEYFQSYEIDKSAEVLRRSLDWLLAPYAISTNPLKGSYDNSRNSSISIYFNEKMDTDSIETAFTIYPYIQGDLSWDVGCRLFTYQYDGDLAAGTEYTIYIDTSALDATGQNLKEEYAYSFTIGTHSDITPPSVLSIIPTNGDNTEIAVDSSLEIRFSEPMDITGLDYHELQVRGLALRPIKGNVSYNSEGHDTVIFKPHRPFAGGETITITLPSGWTDSAGNTLSGASQKSFTVVRPDLKIERWYPSTKEPGAYDTSRYPSNYITIYLRNQTGQDITNLSYTYEVFNEYANQPYFHAYVNHYTNALWHYLYYPNLIKAGEQSRLDLYTYISAESSPYQSIPYILWLRDDKGHVWADSFSITTVGQDTTPPYINNIWDVNTYDNYKQESYYIPVGRSISFFYNIIEFGPVCVEAHITSDVDESKEIIEFTDIDGDRIFELVYRPQHEAEYTMHVEAVDEKGNRGVDERTVWFTSRHPQLKAHSDILLVFEYPRIAADYDDVLQSYKEVLTNAGYTYSLWEVDIYGLENDIFGSLTEDVIPNYSLIIWANPFDYELYYPYFYQYIHKGIAEIAVQESLTEFLDNGGSFLLIGTGNNICSITTTFFSEYLHARILSASASGPETATGATGNPIGNGLVLEDIGKVRVIKPLPLGAEEDGEINEIFTYNTLSVENDGITYKTAGLSVSTPHYKTIYYPFDINSIPDSNKMTTLVQRSLNWMLPSTPTEPVLHVPLPHQKYVESPAGDMTITVSNTGSGTMSWTASATSMDNWLRITTGSSGTNQGTISIHYDTNPVCSQQRSGKVTISSPGVKGSPIEVTVTQTEGLDNQAPVPNLPNLPELRGAYEVIITEDQYPKATDNCAGLITATTDDLLVYREPGEYSITWIYDDGRGNLSSQIQQVVVEKLPPRIVSISPNTVRVGGYITIVGQGFGSGGGIVYFGAVQSEDYTLWMDTKIMVKIPDITAGTVQVKVKVGDKESNIKQILIEPPEDLIPPTISINQPPNNAQVCLGEASGITISGTAFDNIEISYVSLQIGSEANLIPSGLESWSYDWNIIEIEEGIYPITATAIDSSGNSALYTIYIQLSVCSDCIFETKIEAEAEDLKDEGIVSETDVYIGIKEEAYRTEAPPEPPSGYYSVFMKIRDQSTVLQYYYHDIRQVGNTSEKWLIKIIVPDDIKEEFEGKWFPRLFWNSYNLCTKGTFRLWSSNRDGDLLSLLVDDMREITEYKLEEDLGYVCIEWSQDAIMDITLSSGWNMISLPILVEDATVGYLFPEAKAVFGFGPKYFFMDKYKELEVGKGYWVCLPEAITYSFKGTAIRHFAISNASSGWSMIGSCSYPSEVFTDNSSIKAIFSFVDRKYKFLGPDENNSLVTIEPGKGYWMNLSNTTPVVNIGASYLNRYRLGLENEGNLTKKSYNAGDLSFVITATGLDISEQYLNEADVIIGLSEIVETVPAPPLPPECTVFVKIKDANSDTDYNFKDIRQKGKETEVWLLKVQIPEEIPILGEDYYPMLSWNLEDSSRGSFELRRGREGQISDREILIEDMNELNYYQAQEIDGKTEQWYTIVFRASHILDTNTYDPIDVSYYPLQSIESYGIYIPNWYQAPPVYNHFFGLAGFNGFPENIYGAMNFNFGLTTSIQPIITREYCINLFSPSFFNNNLYYPYNELPLSNHFMYIQPLYSGWYGNSLSANSSSLGIPFDYLCNMSYPLLYNPSLGIYNFGGFISFLDYNLWARSFLGLSPYFNSNQDSR